MSAIAAALDRYEMEFGKESPLHLQLITAARAELAAKDRALGLADTIEFSHNKRCPCTFCRQVAAYRAAREAKS